MNRVQQTPGGVPTEVAAAPRATESAPPATRGPAPDPRVAIRGSAWHVLPFSLCASALAVLLVALGYASARTGEGPAVPLFWSGQVLLLLAPAAVLLARAQSRAALNAAVIALAVGQWLTRVAYQPTRLEFTDELQHQRSALDILQTGHLFPQNYSLPISQVYPGLEAVAVGLTRVTGLDLHVSELVTAGLGHTLGAAALLVLLHKVTEDARAVALAGVAYLVGSYAVFSTMFAYQTLALPIALLLVAQVLELGRTVGWARRLAVITLLGALVVVTHHLTGFFVLAALLFLTLAQALFRASRRTARRTAVATVVYAALLATWTATAARSVVGYLQPPLAEFVNGIADEADNNQTPLGVGQPLVERAFTYGSIVLPLLGLGIAAILAWRTARRRLALLAATAVVLQLAVVAVRFVASNGTELASRAFAFTAVVTAVAIAAGVAAVRDGRLSTAGFPRRARSSRARLRLRLAVVLSLVVLAVGGTTGGWPPRYERLPTYQVAGYESAMDRHTVSAAEWADSALEPGSRVGADLGNLTAFGTIGNLSPVRGDYRLLFTDAGAAGAGRAVRAYGLEYLVVDERLTQQLPPPVPGTWFPSDARAGTYTAPLPAASLNALDRVPGMQRVFDDGTIRVYELGRSRYVDGGA